eukprot:scaffold37623_cov59-Cyclotella_meneghiniana.AAC.2
MQAVYGAFNNNNLGCTAKEVYANSATVMQGPTSCERGGYIYVNISASIHFNTDLYDVGMYTATSACTPSASASCGLEAATCAVDVLGPDDSANAPNNVLQNDVKQGDDICYDVLAGSGYDLELFEFQKNLKIPCDE